MKARFQLSLKQDHSSCLSLPKLLVSAEVILLGRVATADEPPSKFGSMASNFGNRVALILLLVGSAAFFCCVDNLDECFFSYRYLRL